MESISLVKTVARLAENGPFGLSSLLGIEKVILGKAICSLTLSEERERYAGYQGEEKDSFGALAAIMGEDAVARMAAVANGWIRMQHQFNHETLEHEYIFSGSALFKLNGRTWKVEGDGPALTASQA